MARVLRLLIRVVVAILMAALQRVGVVLILGRILGRLVRGAVGVRVTLGRVIGSVFILDVVGVVRVLSLLVRIGWLQRTRRIFRLGLNVWRRTTAWS